MRLRLRSRKAHVFEHEYKILHGFGHKEGHRWIQHEFIYPIRYITFRKTSRSNPLNIIRAHASLCLCLCSVHIIAQPYNKYISIRRIRMYTRYEFLMRLCNYACFTILTVQAFNRIKYYFLAEIFQNFALYMFDVEQFVSPQARTTRNFSDFRQETIFFKIVLQIFCHLSVFKNNIH